MPIASVATYAKRIPFIRETVESIHNQDSIDRVLVMVGSSPDREAAEAICSGLHVEVVQVEEIGPGKKHLAPLVCDRDDVIVTFDDDMIYPPGHAERLIKLFEQVGVPCGPLGFRAVFPCRPASFECDFLHGEYGWCYRASMIPCQEVIELGKNPKATANDDVYLGWLVKKNGLHCYAMHGYLIATSGVKVNKGARGAGALRETPGAMQRYYDALKETWGIP